MFQDCLASGDGSGFYVLMIQVSHFKTIMINILCTRNIPGPLILHAASENIYVQEQDFISVQPHIRKEDIPLIISLIQQDMPSVIFTSKHAVNILADFIAQQKQDSVSIKWKVYCISEITLQAVKQRFPDAIIEGKGSYAAELAGVILEEKNIKEVWFFCGNLRRDLLPDRLRENDINVNEIAIYETRLTPHAVGRDYKGIIFFSPSAVESFFSMNKLARETVCFAIGKTTASAIKNKAGNEIITSEKQEAQTMIQTVIDYYKQKHLQV